MQGFTNIGGLEPVRPSVALEGDLSVAVDHVETIGPSGVSEFGGIAHPVNQGGKVESQLDCAKARNIHALLIALRILEDDTFLDITVRLPEVARVRLLDVDDVERRAVLILLVKFIEGGNLPPEGRSSVAAEDEHDGLHPAEGRKLNKRFLVLGLEREVGRRIADLEVTGARIQPERPEGKYHEGEVGHVPHDAAEDLRRLAHDGV